MALPGVRHGPCAGTRKTIDSEFTRMTDPAQPMSSTPVSIVVPTYKERESIPHLIRRLDKLRTDFDLDLEVLFMDDDSQDGSVEYVDEYGVDWCRIVVRTDLRRLTPCKPSARIRRATRLRPTRSPSAVRSAWIFGTP